MSRLFGGTISVRVVPCDTAAGCYRWIIVFGDGRREVRSAYVYATAEGARLAGVVRTREIGGRLLEKAASSGLATVLRWLCSLRSPCADQAQSDRLR